MANMQVQSLYAQKKREFAMVGNGTERFELDFLDALVRALRTINRRCNLATRITYPTSTEQTVALDEDYEDVVGDVVTVNLVQMGQKLKQGSELDYKVLVASIPRRIDEIRTDIINQAQDSDTDDETDFVGLGALG